MRQNEIIERLFRQRQTERPGFRAVSGRVTSGRGHSQCVSSFHPRNGILRAGMRAERAISPDRP
jgi:hypothetical protein